MKLKKNIAIYDNARHLAITSATVSRGLKDYPAVNKLIPKKIQNVAKELGYRHNNFASNLRKQQTNSIGVIVHELNSNFITSVLAGIENETTEAGDDITIAHSSECFKIEATNVLNLSQKRGDDLVASLAVETNNLDQNKALKEKTFRLFSLAVWKKKVSVLW